MLIDLTDRQITLIRVALLQRVTRIKRDMEGYNPSNSPDATTLKAMQASHDESKELITTGPLGLGALMVHDIPKEVRKPQRQREPTTLSRHHHRSD